MRRISGWWNPREQAQAKQPTKERLHRCLWGVSSTVGISRVWTGAEKLLSMREKLKAGLVSWRHYHTRKAVGSWTSGHWVVSWVYPRHMVEVLTDRSGRFCHHEVWRRKSSGLFGVLAHGECLEMFCHDATATSVPCCCPHSSVTVPCSLISFPTHLQVHIRKWEEAHLLRLYLYEVSLPLLGEISLLPLSSLLRSFILSFKFGGNQLEFREHPQEKITSSRLLLNCARFLLWFLRKQTGFKIVLISIDQQPPLLSYS